MLIANVGELRKYIDGLPDSMPLKLEVEDDTVMPEFSEGFIATQEGTTSVILIGQE